MIVKYMEDIIFKHSEVTNKAIDVYLKKIKKSLEEFKTWKLYVRLATVYAGIPVTLLLQQCG
jgi:hypothetical protein